MSVTSRFLRDSSGNIGIIFGLSLVPLVGFAGAAIDYSRAVTERGSLQVLTDRAALVAAKSGGLSDQARIALAASFFPTNTGAAGTNTAAQPDSSSIASSASVSGRSVTVTATRRVKTAVLNVVGIPDIAVSARSTALRTNNGPPVCVLALNPTAGGAVTFTGSASFVAEGCAIHANSSAAIALSISGSASVTAAGFCAYGGVSAPSNLVPQPERNCDRQDDPFRNLAPAQAGGCYGSNTGVQVQPNQQKTLQPGTYCRGLDLKGTVRLEPGLYVIKDGSLSINSQARVTGEGVTFYLTGSGAGFTLNGGGAVTLSAMTSGPYQGLLIVQDRASNAGSENKLNGDASMVLQGAIYTPTQALAVTGSSGFGQTSPFMPIIADQIKFAGSTTAQSDVSAMKTPAPIPLSYTGARLTD